MWGPNLRRNAPSKDLMATALLYEHLQMHALSLQLDQRSMYRVAVLSTLVQYPGSPSTYQKH